MNDLLLRLSTLSPDSVLSYEVKPILVFSGVDYGCASVALASFMLCYCYTFEGKQFTSSVYVTLYQLGVKVVTVLLFCQVVGITVTEPRSS